MTPTTVLINCLDQFGHNEPTAVLVIYVDQHGQVRYESNDLADYAKAGLLECVKLALIDRVIANSTEEQR